MLSEESKAEIQAIRERVPDPRSALLPALSLAQADYGGWLPQQALEEVAGVMGLPLTHVAAAASFYTMLYKKPVGRYVVQVCTNISCSLLNAEHLVAYIGNRLGIQPGETSEDGMFTLLEVECLGSCGTAPMMQINERYYENLTEEKVDQILDNLLEGAEGT